MFLPALAAVEGAAAGNEMAKLQKELRKSMKETLTPEEFEKWEREQTEERRHREICDAIRASKSNPVKESDDFSFAKVIIGASIIGSMVD